MVLLVGRRDDSLFRSVKSDTVPNGEVELGRLGRLREILTTDVGLVVNSRPEGCKSEELS